MSLTTATFIVCTTLTAIDGDSVNCDGVNMRLLGRGEPFVNGVDTPEIGHRAKCVQEGLQARMAKARLTELLSSRGIRVEDSGLKDRWKRPLVRVWINEDRTAGETLIAEGLAKEWRRSKKIDWCNGA